MKKFLLFLPVAVLFAGCWGSRYVSADSQLEEIYVGKTYYEVLDDFGRPTATVDDGMQGTKAIFRNVSLNGTRAADLYRRFDMRNKSTKLTGEPTGDVTFYFKANMRCYAVDSDLQHRRVKEKKEQPAPNDPNRWAWERPQVPRTLDFPTVERRSVTAEVINIERVEVGKDNIKVHFRYHARTPKHRPVPDNGISVMPEIYLEDAATGRRSALIEAEGITLYPEPTFFAHNVGGYDMLNYTLTFEPVERNTTVVNIIEPGHSGCSFYGIDIRTRLQPRLE